MTNERRVLRVFLSSTASDMTACREKVRDTVLQLQQLPIGMETFTPQPTTPVADCMKLAAEADVVIVMVAYRYGSPPSAALGGDGKRSVTWLEVEAAKQARKPIYAYLIDPRAGWDQSKETDLLNTEPEEKHNEILARIRGLKEFKEFLNVHCTWAHFASVDDLAAKVATSLATHLTELDPHTVRTAREWQPRICYPLQPALHFQGRDRLRAELSEWARSRVAPDRVISLVAMGGTGKTALAERVLREMGEQSQVGLLVWSFYENPRTEEFLRTACEYFTGETPKSAGGLLERLQIALTGGERHLLVLDGLERVQAEGTTGRPRGELEDPQLRRLVRWLAAGQGTRTRALVTSRFPLVDLDDWKHAGHREERLEDLEPAAARAVLRGWGVKGDDATLEGLAAPLGYHALSVAVLGSYLGKLWSGDPTKAPTFDRGELAAADPKAAKLTRILTNYAGKLTDAERDLLARLATFPRGVTVEFFGFLIDAGGQIAGALAGCNQVRLLTLLEQLRDLGLVFRCDTSQGSTFSAHPFLRDYFRGLLGVTKPEDVHEAVRVRLAKTLEAKPKAYPTDPATLNRYEALIEHTRLAGRKEEAFALFWLRLGNLRHLAHRLGEYSRGLRILSAFSQDNSPETAGADLPAKPRALMVGDWGGFAQSLGDLASAHRSVVVATELARGQGEELDLLITLYNKATIELLAGQLPAALESCSAPITEWRTHSIQLLSTNSHALCGAILARLGRLDDAIELFRLASNVEDHPQLYSVRGIWEAEFRLETGDRIGAKTQTHANRILCVKNNWTDDEAKCNTLLGLLVLPDDSTAARVCVDAARNYGSTSGNVEVQLRCYHLAAEIARAERAYDVARSEAEAGIHLADTCGFGHYAIELRLALARALLDAGDPKAALQRAREALDRSVHTECQYAWGEADGLHLCGVAHARLGELDFARARLTAALAKRQLLTHPGLADTRAELDRLAT